MPVHRAILTAAIQLTASSRPDGRAIQAVSSALRSAAALPRTYRIRPGDSLSSIAGHFYHDRAYWPVLYWRNRHEIRWADDIHSGQLLHVPARPPRIPPAPGALRPPPRDGHGRHRKPDGRARHSHRKAPADDYYGGPVPGGAFGRCVVERESSRRPQVMNSTRHYGLYQFSEATWVEYGGKRSEFGHATVAEQSRVFANALARHGKYNWIPYDHC